MTIVNAIAYSPELEIWVAAGDGAFHNVFGWSYDGIRWTGACGGCALQGIFVTWSSTQGLFMAGGNAVSTSSDGINWNFNSVLPGISGVRGATFVKQTNLWVVIGGGGGSASISTASNIAGPWTPYTASPTFNSFGYSIDFSAPLPLLMGGGAGSISYGTLCTAPPNATLWTCAIGAAGPLGADATIYTIGWGNGTFVVGGVPSAPNTNLIATSHDGITYTICTTTVFTSQVNGVHYAEDYGFWTAVGNAGTNTMGVSFDNGITWTGLGNDIFPSGAFAVHSRYRVINTPT